MPFVFYDTETTGIETAFDQILQFAAIHTDDDLNGHERFDIRYTVTTGMATLGIAPHVADKIMNHQSGTISGVATVYQRNEVLDEHKTALEAWLRSIQALMEELDRGNVASIHDD